MEEEKGKEYKFDHKKLKEIRERELRELQRRNQYQSAMLKKDEAMNKKFRIYDYWAYKERFRDAKNNIKHVNPFFNRGTISNYIEVAFEIKTHPEAPNRFMRLPKIKKKVPDVVEIVNTDNLD
jgi:hypothetical protein